MVLYIISSALCLLIYVLLRCERMFGLWMLGLAGLLSRSYGSTLSVPVVLKIHIRFMEYDYDPVGQIYLPSTMEVVRIGESGTILQSCQWCPRGSELQPEIEFVLAQHVHLRGLRNGSEERSVHTTYELVLDSDACPYKVYHTNGECEVTYRSSGERVDTVDRCNLTDEEVRGTEIKKFLGSCSALTQKWTSVYQNLVTVHRIENVYALFWEDYVSDGNYTTCVLHSFAPFINIITLSGPGLTDVTGSTERGTYGTVTEAYNLTHPNIRCYIESPTGWDAVITRLGERGQKISLAARSIDRDDDVEAADIRAALLIIVGIFLVIFLCVCWIKRRDIIDSMAEMHEWSRGKKRRQYARLS